MRFLPDTCFFSEFTKARPSAQVVAWSDRQPESSLYLSVLTLGELQQGIPQMAPSPRRQELEDWLHQGLIPRFSGRILDITHEVALAWGSIQGEARRGGKPRSVLDSLIAATAKVHRLAVVTRDVGHMQGMGVELVNPWASASSG